MLELYVYMGPIVTRPDWLITGPLPWPAQPLLHSQCLVLVPVKYFKNSSGGFYDN